MFHLFLALIMIMVLIDDFVCSRFINARRRIVQPMIDQSNRAGNIFLVHLHPFFTIILIYTCIVIGENCMPSHPIYKTTPLRVARPGGRLCSIKNVILNA